MTGLEITRIIELIESSVGKIQNLGENWYKASEDWNDFPRKVKNLRSRIEILKRKFAEHGIVPGDESKYLIDALKDASDLLSKEADKLEQRSEASGVGRRSKATKTMKKALTMTRMAIFPGSVGLSIQNLIKAIDAIPQNLSLEEDMFTKLQSKAIREPLPSPNFRGVRRYVRLEVSESEIQDVLENPDNPAVVVLYGGPGRGKTSVARYLYMLYGDKEREKTFGHVFFLDCGPNATKLEIKLDLVNQLGGASGMDFGMSDAGLETKIDKLLLSSRLREEKILLIMDDIWEGDLLQSILMKCGRGVKCLVTSRNARLGSGFDDGECISFKIQDIDEEKATNILASHVGLKDNLIPLEAQGIAKKMIEQAERHPLAIASLATLIKKDRSHTLQGWESASRNLFESLHVQDTEHILGNKYPTSFMVTLKNSIGKLDKDSRKLLILASACEGTSAPEGLFEIAYRSKRFGRGPLPFSRLRDTLEDYSLLVINNTSVQWNKSRTISDWSLHSLYKLSITKQMKKEVDTFFTSLFGDDMKSSPTLPPRLDGDSQDMNKCEIIDLDGEDAEYRVLLCICALYFNDEFRKKAARRLGISLEEFSQLKRGAVEPLLWLLQHPIDQEWTETTLGFVRRVFLKYIMEGVLDDVYFSRLLAMDLAAPVIVESLRQITFTDTTPMLYENTRGILSALFSHLGEHTASDMKVAVLITLNNFACILENAPKLISFSGLLKVSVRLLQDDTDETRPIRFCAMVILSNITRRATMCRKLFSDYPWLYDRISCFLKDGDPGLQYVTTALFLNLSEMGLEGSMKILDNSAALSKFIDFLHLSSEDVYFGRQKEAFGIIARLAQFEPARSNLMSMPRLTERLWGILADDKETPNTQSDATIVLTLLDWQQASEANLPSGHAYRGRAIGKTIKGMYQEALEDFEKACQLHQGEWDSRFHGYRGIARLSMGLHEKALDDFQKDLQLRRGDMNKGFYVWGWEFYLRRGLAKVRLEKYEDGLEDLEKADDFHQGEWNWTFHANRGIARLMMGMHKEALDDFQKAEQLDGGRCGAMFNANRGTARLRIGMHKEALDDFEKADQLSCGEWDWRFYLDRGLAKMCLQMDEHGLKDFEKADDLHQGEWDWTFHANRGTARLLMGLHKKALDDFQKAEQLHRGDLDAGFYANRGSAMLGIGMLKEALDDFEKADELHCGEWGWEFYLCRGLAKVRLEKYEDGLEDLEKADELYQGEWGWMFYKDRGVTKMSLSMHREALEDFDKADRLHGGGVAFDILCKKGFCGDVHWHVRGSPGGF